MERIAPCPVITFGPNAKVAMSPQEPAFRSILFATDFGAGSAKALPYVRAMASAPSTNLALLHMIAPMPVSTNLSAYAPASAAADEFKEWEGSSRARSLQQLKEWWLNNAKLARDVFHAFESQIGRQRSQRFGRCKAPADGAACDAGGAGGLDVPHFIADRNRLCGRNAGALDDATEFGGLAEQRGAAVEMEEQCGKLAELLPCIRFAVG